MYKSNEKKKFQFLSKISWLIREYILYVFWKLINKCQKSLSDFSNDDSSDNENEDKGEKLRKLKKLKTEKSRYIGSKLHKAILQQSPESGELKLEICAIDHLTLLLEIKQSHKIHQVF